MTGLVAWSFSDRQIIHHLVVETLLQPITPITSKVGAVRLVAHGVKLKKRDASNTEVCDSLIRAVSREPRHIGTYVWRAVLGEVDKVPLHGSRNCGVNFEWNAKEFDRWRFRVEEG